MATAENKIKHLEFIQAVINRVSTNSFLLKGWSVVLVSAMFALAANGSNVAFVMLAYIPAIVFWGLDGYFLGLERAYRAYYDKIRRKPIDEIDFCMKIDDMPKGFSGWVKSTLSKTLIPFHGAVLIAILLVMFMLSKGGSNGS